MDALVKLSRPPSTEYSSAITMNKVIDEPNFKILEE